MTDGELHDAILDTLDRDTRLDARHIDVSVRDGVASLDGYVRSYAEKRIATRIVGSLARNCRVEENLGIRYPRHSRPVDSEIAEQAEALLRRLAICRHEIRASVRHGRVTLKGCVPGWSAAVIAEAAIEGLPGVIGIDNLLTVGSADLPGGAAMGCRERLPRRMFQRGRRPSPETRGGAAEVTPPAPS